ncbi:hypothetical protein CapIbe_014097 [Capra ibex]
MSDDGGLRAKALKPRKGPVLSLWHRWDILRKDWMYLAQRRSIMPSLRKQTNKKRFCWIFYTGYDAVRLLFKIKKTNAILKVAVLVPTYVSLIKTAQGESAWSEAWMKVSRCFKGD